MIGRTISHYRIVAELGQGGMGRVFRAEDTLLGRPVALKFLHEDVDEPGLRERLLREARIASVLDHPNIVVLYDVGEADGEIFLALQCVEGRSLRERLQSGTPSLNETLGIGRAIADALAHAHGRSVVHRDVKPDNILLCADGRVKVTDFGLALSPDHSRLTRGSELVGTPLYAAPEVFRGLGADARSDLYSLGIVLYELCAGSAPFAGEAPATILYRVLNEEPAPLSDALPPAFKALMRSLLAKAPEQRPASAAEVAQALDRLVHDAPAPESGSARSIAVLPFENLTGNREDDYFCAGMTEDLLTDILRIPDLQVASRTMVDSLKGRGLDARQAGRTLGVATVLEGGVRRAGDRVRVTTRLVRTDSGFQLWAERYDRTLADIFEVQEDVSRQIAQALRVVFDPQSEDARLGRRTRSPRAYDLRLQALQLHRRLNEADMRRAIELLEESVREDPDYALGRADLAEAYVQMVCKAWDPDASWLDRAEREIARALDLAPGLPEACRTRGHVAMHRRRPLAALQDFQLAAELDPRLASALNSAAVAYMAIGDPRRAEVYARRAREADPRLVSPVLNLAQSLIWQERFDEARSLLATVPALEPGLQQQLYGIELAIVLDGRLGNAAGLERARRELETLAPHPFANVLSAVAEAYLGAHEAARRRLADPALSSHPLALLHVNRARAHMLLGEREAALSALEKAFSLDVADLGAALGDPALAALLEDSRFDALHEHGLAGGRRPAP